MPDNGQGTTAAPATSQGGSPSGSATTPGASQPGTATPAVDVATVLAENARLREREQTQTKAYNDIRKFATQKSQEAAALRRERESWHAAGGGNNLNEFDEAPASGSGAASSGKPDWAVALETNQAIIQFKLDHPDWTEQVREVQAADGSKRRVSTWDEMNDLLDETNPVSNTLAGATPYLTLKNAYREVRLQQLQRAKAEADAANAAADVQRNRLRIQAGMSGQAATDGQEIIDVSGMTPEQMVEAGLVGFDPTNPPSHVRKLNR